MLNNSETLRSHCRKKNPYYHYHQILIFLRNWDSSPAFLLTFRNQAVYDKQVQAQSSWVISREGYCDNQTGCYFSRAQGQHTVTQWLEQPQFV